jgi:MHS family proline/betaine transporter-like MFS transporter
LRDPYPADEEAQPFGGFIMFLTRSGPLDPHPTARRRALVGACVGNAVEWYDFAVYGAFAPILAGQFFPTGSEAALAATFAVFATSFIARPVGAIVLGRYADRLGRRPVFSLMITLMSVATAGIGLLPTWSSVGALAPVSLVLLRLVQGLSSGGEVPSSMVFLVESAPSGRRGWFGGWHLSSIAMGLTAGYGAVALLSTAVSDDALAEWGWRIAFLVAAPLGLAGRFIRRRLHETPAFTSVTIPRTPRLVDVLRGRETPVRQGFVLVAVLSLTFNVWFVFLPAHLVTSGTTTLGRALALCLVGLLATVASAPLMGGLSDRVGRRPLLIAATLGVAAFAAPGFALAWSHSVPGILVSNLVMGVLVGSMTLSAFVAELFPAEMRVTGSAVAYGFATAVFGGSAPLVAAALVGLDVAWLVPVYVAAMAALAVGAALRAEETAFGELG